MGMIRPAAVAGMFYPDDPATLQQTVRGYFAEAPKAPDPGEQPVPKIIVAPHAGHVYSGLTAAYAYNRIAPARDTIKRVVIMGPCHRVPVRGIAASGADAFATPLGNIPVDTETVRKIIRLPFVHISDEAHAEDHCIEVHLPFLQSLLGDFSIVPLIVGRVDPQQVAQLIEILWGGPETLILISSDLSHYLSYEQARRLDGMTRDAIERMAIDEIGDDQACGRYGLKGAMHVAKRRGLRAQTLDVRNSGDTAGSKDRVVGYGSWMFVPEGKVVRKSAPTAAKSSAPTGGAPGAASEAGSAPDKVSAETRLLLKNHGPQLLDVAARTLRHGVTKGRVPAVNVPSFPVELREHRASFVTLDLEGKLRGCIGSLQAHKPLIEDVVENAFKAGFRDPRFKPLGRDEVESGKLELSVSVLSPNVEMAFADEKDLLAQLRPGIDGLIIRDGEHRSVFLPAVWEDLPDRRKFMSHLKRKAGLKESHWSERFEAWRFTTEVIYGHQLSDPGALWRPRA